MPTSGSTSSAIPSACALGSIASPPTSAWIILRKRTRTRRIFGIPIYLDGGDEDEDSGPRDVAQPGSASAFDGVAERDHINRALRRMSPKYATCLVLHSAQGLSYREIAVAFGITPGAAAVRLARARDMFARHYDDVRKEGQR